MSERIIRALSKDVADKIAAGEVVERPLSIVKELLENSIDAGSNAVTIEIKKGGKEYIRVSDNGCGIAKDQLELAFTRYATSKIATEEDLEKIGTLGFRGEALASIASVASVEMITRTEDTKTGSKISVTASEIDSIDDTACEVGTTIIVKDLFYNIPARKKFLKPDNTESSLITDYVSKMALAYPDVKIRMISNGTILFSTTGKGDLKQAILTVFSPQIAKSLIPVAVKDEEKGLCVKGYISQPTESKTNRKWQIFFVNGRLVKSKLLENAVSDAYHDKMFEGHYPVVFLFLDLNPTDLDVNIHPHKTEVRFYNENEVSDFLISAIRKDLLNPDALNYHSKEEKTAQIKVEKTEIEIPVISKTNDVAESEITVSDTDTASATDNSFNFKAPISFSDVLSDFKKDQQNEVQEELFEYTENSSKDKLFEFSSLEFIGQAFDTYLICKDKDNILFIDQHAAHERIMYEKLIGSFNDEESAAQALLTPILLELTNAEKLIADDAIIQLSPLGFSFDEFGPTSYLVKEIPACMDISEAEAFLNEFIDAAEENRSSLQLKKDQIITRSCKSAVKAHDKLSISEIKRLFEDLDKCENPFSCPHGRPTFVRFSEYEIERLFKRK